MVTKLEDARAFKAMKMPLNTPVQERTFGAEFSKGWDDLTGAYGSFMGALAEYVEGPRAGSIGKWKLLERRLRSLRKAILAREDLIDLTEADDPEGNLLAEFLMQRALPFLAYWESAVEAVNGGAELTIRPGDVPVWFDGEQ